MADAALQRSSRIFISYRREDSSGHVLALLPALRSHFGAERIFKDTDNIPPGEDFVKFIKRELESCSVLLAIIGREWLTIQDPRTGTRRLDNPEDFLRVEVATALKNDRILVIPVLVERATMPTAQELPPDLAALAFRNALELADGRWESDVQLLVEAIERACKTAEAPVASPDRPELLDLQKRRAREIAGHLTTARDAFENADFEATLWACERALVLNPERADALDLMDRARKAIDQQKIARWLKQAREALAQRDTGEASDLIDQALALDTSSEAALALRKQMLALRRERERERERARGVQAATDRARISLEEGDFEAAVRHADDALAVQPEAGDALRIRGEAVAGLEERRREREVRRLARQAVTAARERFAAGDPQAAVDLLRDFSPPHELVAQALHELEGQISRAAASRRQADAALVEAGTRLAVHDLQSARRLVAEARNRDPGHPDLPTWLERIEQHEDAGTGRREAVREAVAQARDSLERGEFELAIRHADAALALDPADADATTVRETARTALEELRAQVARADADAAAPSADGRRKVAERDARERTADRTPGNAPRAPAEGRTAVDPRVHQLLADAEAAFAGRDFKLARAKAEAALRLAPEDSTARGLLASAARTLHEATPEFWPPRNVLRYGAAAAIVLSTTVAIYYYNGAAPEIATSSTREVASREPSGPEAPPEAGRATAPPAAPDPNREAPAAAPPSTVLPSADPPAAGPSSAGKPATAAAPDRLEVRLNGFRTAARARYRAGDRARALEAAQEGLKLAPDDRGLRIIVNSLAADGKASAERARTAAREAGAEMLASSTFAEALKLETTASRSLQEARTEAAVRGFWSAASRYDLAARRARDQRTALAKANPEAAGTRGTQPSAGTEPGRASADPTGAASSRGDTNAAEADTRPSLPNPAHETKPLTPKPAAADRASELRLVDAALKRYEEAYDALDFAAVREIYPGAPRELAREFSDYNVYRLEIICREVTLAGDARTATATCQLLHAYQPKIGRPARRDEVMEFLLEKRGGSWIIARQTRARRS